jgi:hypothetical protein
MKTRLASLAALLLGAAFLSAAANAATIETFKFTQTGYVGDDILTGSFTGTVEADGSIQQADLTAFTASFLDDRGSFGIQIDSYSLANLQLFSFRPAMDGPNASLDIFASVTSGPPGSICVGAAAAFGLCGVGGNLFGVDHLIYQQNAFLWVTSTQAAVVQFVPAQSASAPEPLSISLCALALLSTIAWRRRAAVRQARQQLR